MAMVETVAVGTAGEVPLKTRLRRAERRRKAVAFGLVVPLLAFVVVSFVLPIGAMLYRSVDNPLLAESLPETLASLEDWDGTGAPGEETFAALARELVQAGEARTLGKIGGRLNDEESGLRSLVTKTGRQLDEVSQGPYRPVFLEIDARWGDPALWRIIERLGARYTLSHYITALDLRYDAEGRIVAQPESRQIYIPLFMRTLWVGVAVTAICLALAYPLAYVLAGLPSRTSNLLMILVLLPFWTSLLVRTTAWIVLLQTQGVVNDLLVLLGLVDDGQRLVMMHNMTGTLVAMVHILLPFMLLPIYSVMRSISPSYMRAALGLGANPAVAFWRVYAPQTVPGVGAGSILVFILAMGYYITPALVGGRSGQLISSFIAFHMQSSLNWGLAAALGTILLVGVLALYLLYSRLVGIGNLKLG